MTIASELIELLAVKTEIAAAISAQGVTVGAVPFATYADLISARGVASLFDNGEQGAWYDPSDMATLFQDSAGTIPVTAVEQFVGLMLDKSKGLVLGPELATPLTPANWSVSGTDATHIVTFSNNTLRYQSGTTSPQLSTSCNAIGGLILAGTYEITVVVSSYVSGGVKVFENAGASGQLSVAGLGTFKGRITVPSGASLTVTRTTTNVDLTISSISCKKIEGNHALQPTSANRPVLSARVNLFVQTENLMGSAWYKGNGATTTATSITFNGATQILYQTASSSLVGETLTVSAYLSGSGSVRMAALSGTGGDLGVTTINLTNSPTRYSVTVTNAASGTSCGIVLRPVDAAPITFTATKFQFEKAAVATTYQRVNTATDYDTIGFKRYLSFNGTTQAMSTAAINFSTTDKMMVCAGVRKLSDAATGMVVELSSVVATNPGSFYLIGPSAANGNNYAYLSRGSIDSSSPAISTSAQSPNTSVLTGVSNISAATMYLRRNTVQVSSAGAQGTGNYGNYQLFIGARAGTSLFFNGNLYGLLIRGAASSAQQISAAEYYMNTKTGAY